ncbi:MAG: hypothetical protein ABIH89_10780 [Elusimicrobiota bacterium]
MDSLKLLILSNDNDDAELLCAVLGEYGFNADRAVDSDGIQNKFAEIYYDAVLIDSLITPRHCLELAGAIRKNSLNSGVTVAVLSRLVPDEETFVLMEKKKIFFIYQGDPFGRIAAKLRYIIGSKRSI